MAVIYVRSVDVATGVEVPGSGLRTGSPQSAVDHALMLNGRSSATGEITRISYFGSFVDDAFTELAQLAQRHELPFNSGEE
jgi:hypothetical protein